MTVNLRFPTDNDILESVALLACILTEISTKLRNGLIAIAAIFLGLVLFLTSNSQSKQIGLESVINRAIPIQQAQTNGKPSLIEFYADWCTSCLAMSHTMAELEDEFGNEINFVMLNVDNMKWLPELTAYGVNGIPHFEFLDADGHSLGVAIGQQPKPIMTDNLMALVSGQPLQANAKVGQASSFAAPVGDTTQPRSHG